MKANTHTITRTFVNCPRCASPFPTPVNGLTIKGMK